MRKSVKKMRKSIYFTNFVLAGRKRDLHLALLNCSYSLRILKKLTGEENKTISCCYSIHNGNGRSGELR